MKKRKVCIEDEDIKLNPNLVSLQCLSVETELRIRHSHVVKSKIFKKMAATDDVALLRSLARRVERLEFMQQKLWGFPLDRSYHFWYRVPKCTCPKLDNSDAWGVPNQRITVSDCPIHWVGETEV